jgi:HAD superfamily hydrolase (TIGR01509 family)
VAGVLLDVDGTLVDSNYLHVIAWARAFRAAGHRVPMARLHRLVGMGSAELTEAVLGEASAELSAAHGHEFDPLRPELRALPGAVELLAELRRRGLTTVLATSAKEKDLPHLLEALGDPEVDVITTSADAEQGKPEPDIFAVALQRSGLDPAAAVAVGDTRWDIEAAGRLGLGCLAVETGGWSATELLEAGAAAVFRDCADLLGRIDSSPLGVLSRA